MQHQSIIQQIRQLFIQFDHTKIEKIKQLFQQVTVIDKLETEKINHQLQKIIRESVMQILQKNNRSKQHSSFLQDLTTFLNTVCNLEQKLIPNTQFNNSLEVNQSPQLRQQKQIYKIGNDQKISLMQTIVECLGVVDLSKMLIVISKQITKLQNLSELQKKRLLKMVNVLLRRVSKTEDYFIRGQLHLTMSSFLPIFHDSGFHFKAAPIIVDPLPNDQEIMSTASDVCIDFYRQFWAMQQSLMNPNRQKKEPFFLQKVYTALKQTVKYMQSNKARKNQQLSLKFVRNLSLFSCQLNDETFRCIIMTQVMIFCHSLLRQIPPVIESEKQLILQIQQIATNTLKNIDNNLLKGVLKSLQNQEFWIDLKQNWKQHKKNYLKKSQLREQEETKDKIKELRIQITKELREKLKINGSCFQQFLNNRDIMKLQKKPTLTSFAYYYSQAKECYDSFDQKEARQTSFQTRNQYNVFEWKAMRSLYRQNLNDKVFKDKEKIQSSIREYRLLTVLDKKIQEFEGQPRKIIKLNP